jgi:hypothetical protein
VNCNAIPTSLDFIGYDSSKKYKSTIHYAITSGAAVS